MKILAIVQARMGSTRLPNKVMQDICGKPAIQHVLERLNRSNKIEKIVLATSVNQENDKLEKFVNSLGFNVYRGDELDVLDRFYKAAEQYKPESVVRITGDCPLIDPEVVDQVISYYEENGAADYVSNIDPPSFPDGLDTEVFSFDSLEKAWINAKKKREREHVTPYLRENDLFSKKNFLNNVDYSKERWTLDDKDDLLLIRKIFEKFDDNMFSMKNILSLKEDNPDFFKDNIHSIRNEGADMGSGQKLWTRAKQIIPGGNSLLSKRSEMFLPGNWPSYYKKAEGYTVWDLDGNEYKDFCIMGIGTNTLGYARKEVNDAVKKAIDDSTCSTLSCYEEVYLAEKLINMHPWADQVRYSRTGGEACAIAIRIARAASGKDKVAFCGYHGWHDWYLSSNLADDSNLNSMLIAGLDPAGVPSGLAGSAIPFEYNNLTQLKNIISQGNVGVIMMEPFRNKEPEDDFLQEVRKLATDNNIVLIFDEVTAAFRKNFGGLHLTMGVEPDMAVFGKALGNGFAQSAVIGKKEVMEASQKTFISSTYWTERTGPVAALETLRIMEEEKSFEQIDTIGKYINKKWLALGEEYNLDLHVEGLPSISHFAFNEDNLERKTYITQEMLKRGYLASNSFYISNAHDEKSADLYLNNLGEVFSEISEFREKSINLLEKLDGDICHSGFQRLN